MSEVTAIDQTPQILESINPNEPNMTEWNGREVTKGSSNNKPDYNYLIEEKVIVEGLETKQKIHKKIIQEFNQIRQDIKEIDEIIKIATELIKNLPPSGEVVDNAKYEVIKKGKYWKVYRDGVELYAEGVNKSNSKAKKNCYKMIPSLKEKYGTAIPSQSFDHAKKTLNQANDQKEERSKKLEDVHQKLIQLYPTIYEILQTLTENIHPNRSNTSDFNCRVNIGFSNKQSDLVNNFFKDNAEKIKVTKTELAKATEALKAKTKEIVERKSTYKKRKHEDDQAYGWNKKQKKKRLEKAEKKLGFAQHEQSQQKSVVEKLQKEVDSLVSAENHLKSSMEPERYADLKQYVFLSKSEIKDSQDFDPIINRVELELNTKKEKLTKISQDLDLKREALKEANKKYGEKVDKYDKSSKHKKASREWEKVKEAEKSLDRALKNCAQKLKEHDDLFEEVDALETEFKCLKNAKKRRQENETKNPDRTNNENDPLKTELLSDR